VCDYTVATLDDLGDDPVCPACAERLRPGVVWFGEPLPTDAWQAAAAAAEECEVMLAIGTSGVVQPAASLVDLARAGGAAVIEINPNVSEASSSCEVCIRAGSRSALLELDQALGGG
jgi:NAD-dependent deacetylase